MKKSQILFEISINDLFDNISEKVSNKEIIPKRKGVEYFLNRRIENKKESFLTKLFGKDYNIKNKLVSTIVFKSEDDILNSQTKSCNILLCKFKNKNFLFLPVLSITISKSGKNATEMLNNLLTYCSKIFPYFFDVDFQTCCKNNIMKTEDKLFVFPFSQNEWNGNATKPRSIVSNNIDELVWVDIIKMLEDPEYSKNYLLSESTIKILNWFLGTFR